MKINIILFCVVWLAIGSCKKKEDAPNPEKTDNALETLASVPVLHMSFKAGTSEEEIEKQWNEALKSYNREVISQKTSGTRKYHYGVTTRTGTKKYDATDSPVSGEVYFTKDRYTRGALNFTLNNPGDDREKGQTDRYLFEVDIEIPFYKIAFTSAYVKMGGNDGWGIEYFNAYSSAEMHDAAYPYVSCNGSVTIGGGDNNTCTHEGYTYARLTSRKFIDRNNSKYDDRANTTSNSGVVQVKSGDI